MFAEVMMATGRLYQWKKNPTATKRELGCCTGYKKDLPENNRPFSREEIKSYKNFLLRHAPALYYQTFMDKTLDAEVSRACKILRGWKENPNATKNEILEEDIPENNKPFSQKEIEGYKKLVLRHAPEYYYGIFMEGSIFNKMIKTTEILEKWNRNHNYTKNRLLDHGPTNYTPENDRPLTKKEVKEYKDFLRKYAPPCYRLKFKDEKKSKQKNSKKALTHRKE